MKKKVKMNKNVLTKSISDHIKKIIIQIIFRMNETLVKTSAIFIQ